MSAERTRVTLAIDADSYCKPSSHNGQQDDEIDEVIEVRTRVGEDDQ